MFLSKGLPPSAKRCRWESVQPNAACSTWWNTSSPMSERTSSRRQIGGLACSKRRLGIATITDRVVQASLKLVLKPIFEADFLPCSYGFRPKRRAHNAVAEVRYLASSPRKYE